MSNSIPDDLRKKVQESFHYRCAYCQSSQQYVLGVLEIDHIIPLSLGGTSDETNLCLACRLCNNYKSNQIDAIDLTTNTNVRLFNPRTQLWKEHFEWDETSTQIIGTTPCGRATVDALKLNNKIALIVRKNWVIAGWHPPKD